MEFQETTCVDSDKQDNNQERKKGRPKKYVTIEDFEERRKKLSQLKMEKYYQKKERLINQKKEQETFGYNLS